MESRGSQVLRIQAEMVWAGQLLDESPIASLRRSLSDVNVRIRLLAKGKDPDEIYRAAGGDPADLGG